jgi:SAM-dependent MidA family methyltransferase
MTLLSTTISEKSAAWMRERFGDQNTIPFESFIDWALYDKNLGYYQKNKTRVGKSLQSDFYTSSSFHELWAELVLASCITLVGDQDPRKYTFVEIAAEPESCLFPSLTHPFGDYKVIRLGEDLVIPPLSIVYSNEWLDAQPFRRFSYSKQGGSWHEHAVKTQGTKIREIIIDKPVKMEDGIFSDDINQVQDGYIIDWPTGAHRALQNLLQSSDWKGWFLTFDYGFRTKSEILENKPEGSGRAYLNHTQHNNILQDPGDQDITCHLCWETLIEILEKNNFQDLSLRSQESFLMHHAAGKLEEIINQGNQADINQAKELIHPHYLGQKFQAIVGKRGV